MTGFEVTDGMGTIECTQTFRADKIDIAYISKSLARRHPVSGNLNLCLICCSDFQGRTLGFHAEERIRAEWFGCAHEDVMEVTILAFVPDGSHLHA